MEVSIVLPCYNEEETIGICIDRIRKVLPNAEIIVVNNNSTDKSAKIAKSKNVKVINETKQGYGYALRTGFKLAKGKRVVMGDCDNTYDFEELPELLKHNYDLVIGNRLTKNMEKGSMPFLHKYLGTPGINFLLKTIFGAKIKDSQCGFRVIKKEALENMNLQSTGMELASEMIIKTLKLNLSIKEVPIKYHVRKGESKLSTFRDGWRHLRLILLYGPSYLFLIPGLMLFLTGSLLLGILSFTNIIINGVSFQTHPMIFASAIAILGYNIIILWIFTKIYESEYLNETHPFVDFLNKYFNLEKIIFMSLVVGVVGLGILSSILYAWINAGFGELDKLRPAILGLTLIVISIQTIFSGFFMSILGFKK